MTAVIGMSYKFFQVWRTINPWGRVARRAVEDAGPCECGGGLCALRLGRRLRPHVGMRPCGRQADGNALSNRSPHPSRLRRAAFPRLGKALRGGRETGAGARVRAPTGAARRLQWAALSPEALFAEALLSGVPSPEAPLSAALLSEVPSSEALSSEVP